MILKLYVEPFGANWLLRALGRRPDGTPAAATTTVPEDAVPNEWEQALADLRASLQGA